MSHLVVPAARTRKSKTRSVLPTYTRGVQSPVITRPGLFGGVLRRQWFVLLLTLVLGASAGTAAVRLLPTTYTSAASLLLEPLSGNPFSPTTATTRNEQIAALQTEVALLTTTGVLERAEALAPDLSDSSVSASVPSNSQVIVVAHTASSAQTAQAGAEAFAEAFLAYRQERSDRFEEEQRAALQQQLDDTDALLGTATAQLEAATEDTAEYVQLQQQVQLYASQATDLQVQLLALASSAENPGEVISPASLPTGPDGAPPVAVLLAAVVVGVIAGVLIGLYREHRDPRMHTLDEVGQLSTGAVLSVLDSHRGETATDGYRTLEETVMAALPPQGGIVTLLGSDPSTDSVEAATGLARALVRSGHPCAVVLAEFRGVAGVASTLSHFVQHSRTTPHGQAPGWVGVDIEPLLRLVTAAPIRRTDGAPGDELDDLLQHGRTAVMLHELSASGRVVVVAAPPLPRGSALSLARHADQAVLLVQLDRSSFDVASAGLDQMQRSGATVLGTAVVGASSWRTTDGVRPGGPPLPTSAPASNGPSHALRRLARGVRSDPPEPPPGARNSPPSLLAAGSAPPRRFSDVVDSRLEGDDTPTVQSRGARDMSRPAGF